MVKVVYNADYGGFSLDGKAKERYCELKGIEIPRYSIFDIDRTDPALVQTVEELNPGVLKIRDIPKGSIYNIYEYDGNESVMLQSEYDWSIA